MKDKVGKAPTTIEYRVGIQRDDVGKIDRFMQGEFWYEVDVYFDGEYNGKQRSYGWAKSVAQAKKKALEHILKVESNVAAGNIFGVVFYEKGSSEVIKEKLSA